MNTNKQETIEFIAIAIVLLCSFISFAIEHYTLFGISLVALLITMIAQGIQTSPPNTEPK